jgi:hypothetical protein
MRNYSRIPAIFSVITILLSVRYMEKTLCFWVEKPGNKSKTDYSRL